MSGDDRMDDLPEDEFVRELLGHLGSDLPDPPEALPDRTIRKVQAELTSRDLIDLTTVVFLMRFCAPLLDLLAAFFGHDLSRETDRTTSSRSSADPSDARSDHRRPRDD